MNKINSLKEANYLLHKEAEEIAVHLACNPCPLAIPEIFSKLLEMSKEYNKNQEMISTLEGTC